MPVHDMPVRPAAMDVIGQGYSVAVQVRYRYRIYPAPGQQQALARVFGCARVVYNDCLRLREACHAAGEKISDTEVQRRVITLAKPTPERAWLGEVASVALVQACQDARRAYRNWFDSLSGQAEGPQDRAPAVPAQARPAVDPAHPQRVRRARAAAVRGEGRGHQGAMVPGPAVRPVVGHGDQGAGRPVLRLVRGGTRDHAAARLRSRGRHRPGPGPPGRHLRRRDRSPTRGSCAAQAAQLARAQRALSRKQKGSANRAKARHRVAVLHRKVRETRLDHAHKTALRLVRDNQAVYAEDLAVSGLARTRLAKSVHDAGWSQLLRLHRGESAQYGRDVRQDRPVRAHHRQICSACGRQGRPQAAERPRVDLRGVRHGPRPGRQRGAEHPGAPGGRTG